MPTYKPGDVVLLDFPFVSGASTKRRPALVLLDIGDADIVAARVTSQAAHDSFDVELSDWKAAGLMLPSIVRIHKLATLEKALIVRGIGALSNNDWAKVQTAIWRLWGFVT